MKLTILSGQANVGTIWKTKNSWWVDLKSDSLSWNFGEFRMEYLWEMF